MSEPELTHLDSEGNARMVDISQKGVTVRTATASGFVRMSASTLKLVREGGIEKGDVLQVARLAGIMAAKKTSELIPLCHPIALTDISVEFEFEGEGISVRTRSKTADRTGVEMEAMVAASVAALTLYDMCKGADKGISIESIQLLEKTGGKSGDWSR